MPSWNRKLASWASCVLAGFWLFGCASTPDDEYYKPSDAVDFDFGADSSFAGYLRFEEDKLRRFRVFFDPQDEVQEIGRVAPFELPPRGDCGDAPKRGVLLVHGLLDTAFAMRDIGEALAGHCLLVRAVMLPGHGTRPADLIGIERQRWMDAVAFAVRTLKADVDEVYVAGFSLGGALALRQAIDDPALAGVIVWAPAIEVAYPWLAWQSLWYRYVSDWVDVDPHAVPVRYGSMPTDAIAQTYLLSREVQAGLRQGYAVPTLAFLSADDLVINAETAAGLLTASGQNVVVFGQIDGMDSPLVEAIPVFDPEEKIVSYAHVALTYRPDNAVFGRSGSYRECGVNIGIVAAEDAQFCMANEDIWKGEFGVQLNGEDVPLQRLSYNPRFDSMIKQIADFINQSSEHSS